MGRYDTSLRRWRHLDLGASRLWLEAAIRRLECRRCQAVRTEAVPWARPGARHTRDFQDVVAWLAQRTDKTTITKLLRCSWRAVADIVTSVIEGSLDDARLNDLYRIGVDEVSYRKGHRYLTVVADHDAHGAVVWAREGHDHTVLESFYDELGPERLARLEAVSLDMGGAYKLATDTKASHVRQCVDPFHVIRAANQAIERTRRWAWNLHRDLGLPRAAWVKRTRWALLKDPEHLKDSQLEVLHELRRHRSVLYRCWQLKEALRDLYRLAELVEAPAHLRWWVSWASRSRIPAFVALAKTVRANQQDPGRGRAGVVELQTGGPQLEDPPDQPPRLRTSLRRCPHRLIYLCSGGITVELPMR